MTSPLIGRRQFAFGAAALAFAGRPAFAVAPPAGGGLDGVVRHAREMGVRGLMVLRGGEVLLSEGAVDEVKRIASCRKSIVSALYGMAVAEGRADLDASIGALGIDDYMPLTEAEKGATVRDLLKARSGIYLPTAAETPAMRERRPARGRHAPGPVW